MKLWDLFCTNILFEDDYFALYEKKEGEVWTMVLDNRHYTYSVFPFYDKEVVRLIPSTNKDGAYLKIRIK